MFPASKTPAAALRGVIALSVICALSGCVTKDPPKAVSRYETLPLKNVPPYLKDTILEKTDLNNVGGFAVSSYALVSRLRGTGDSSSAPTAVRKYMIDQMLKRGFGQYNIGYEKFQPEKVLSDPHYAIVRVDGNIPPGARKGETFDVQVSALPESQTTSLAEGELFETALKIEGANPMNPGGSINPIAMCKGPIFVNPAYLLSADEPDATPAAKNSLRYGIVMDGGRVERDREIILRLRQPLLSLSRQIEARINLRFQSIADRTKSNGSGPGIAEAQDDGMVYVYVPKSFNGDWEHFVGVMTHLYMRTSSDYAAVKAKELAKAAVEPDAPLADISYCWEGLGAPAIPAIVPLMSHSDPQVAFAAARAAAFLGEPSALAALASIAQTNDHQFQLNAVQTLGALPGTAQINHMLRQLLDSPKTLVRIEAYRVLARNGDPLIFSKVINEKFVIDIVPSDGPPIVHATRTGLPRIAIIGKRPKLEVPVTFTAFAKRLMIASNDAAVAAQLPPFNEDKPQLTLYWRGGVDNPPIKIQSGTDIAEIVARLGGEGEAGYPRLNFSYADVVAIIQKLADGRKLAAVTSGASVSATFVLQELADMEDSVYNAPVITAASATPAATGDGADALPNLDPTKTLDAPTKANGATGRPQ